MTTVKSVQVGLSPNSDWLRRSIWCWVMHFSTPKSDFRVSRTEILDTIESDLRVCCIMLRFVYMNTNTWYRRLRVNKTRDGSKFANEPFVSHPHPLWSAWLPSWADGGDFVPLRAALSTRPAEHPLLVSTGMYKANIGFQRAAYYAASA